VVARGGLGDALKKMLSDRNFVRSDDGFGLWYERAQDVADETYEAYLRPLVFSPQRVRDLERFFAAWDNKQTVRIQKNLAALPVPTLIVWGTDDIFFDVKWSLWLEKTIPGARRIEYQGARLLFPEERPQEFNQDLREHFTSVSAESLRAATEAK